MVAGGSQKPPWDVDIIFVVSDGNLKAGRGRSQKPPMGFRLHFCAALSAPFIGVL